jgi:hypothetical protein
MNRRSASGLRCPWTAWYCDCKTTLNAWPYPANGKLPKRCQEMLDANAGMAPRLPPDGMRSKRSKQHGKPCPYCGRTMGGKRGAALRLYPTIDHIVPKSRGGGGRSDNKVFVCVQCNQDKGDKSIETWLDELVEFCDPRAKFVAVFMEARGIEIPRKKMRWA